MNFFYGLKEDFQQGLLRKKISLVLRVYISDLVKELYPFRIFCHLLYFKRGFNVVNRCQYCTRCFVETARISCDIERNF